VRAWAWGFALIPAYTAAALEPRRLHAAFLGLGAIVLLVGVPSCTRFSSEEQSPRRQLLAGEFVAPADPGCYARSSRPPLHAKAMRMPQFWALLGAFLLVAGAIFAMALHLCFGAFGISIPVHDRSILAASLLGFAATAGRFCSGYLYDRNIPFPMSRQASLSVAPSAH